MRNLSCLLFALLTLVATGAAQPARKAPEAAVTIRDSSYSPASLTVKRGTIVIWTNADDQDHTVDAGDGSFSSGTLKRKQTFQYTFNKAGKYPYGCKFHPRQKGTIIVIE